MHAERRDIWARVSRIVARDRIYNKVSASWKYVESNIKHARWFFCRNPWTVLRDLTWWVRHRTTDRHHVLHIPSLEPGWWDTDTKLLHASFTLLERFIENEHPFKIIDWNHDDANREFANEVHSLYLWWQRRKQLPDTNDMQEENARYQEETDNLVRLMKIRMVLWT